MSCYLGVEDRDLWWSTKPVNMFEGAPFCLNEFMTKRCFKEIMAVIMFTDGFTPWPRTLPCPVLWCISTKGLKAPVGETLYVPV